jgi:D-alanyl-lipoteichoic acid acyltransferase DltB (MBOAT superfamily)
MLFNSFVFWAFFCLVLTAYRLSGHRTQNRLLLVASYIFYGFWDWRFLFLMFFSTVVDFFVARWLHGLTDERKRGLLLKVSLAVNLSLLGFFKYYGFFANEMNALLMNLGLNSYLPILKIVLPVGISFYTFQTISYTVDVYRRQTTPARSFFDFALYVSFFPQLVAGPIERSTDLLPQVEKPRTVSAGDVREGLYHIVFGLFKKVVVADNMAVLANSVFSQSLAELTAAEVLLGTYAFAFQIYGDFSGYSSIAQGLARMMGFKLMWNFRMPYFAVSPSDFWQRWHISLSSWLRDYLYIPLGGNRGGKFATARNLSLTMLLGGLWHGANWTYIAWGAIHGAVLIVYRVFPRLGDSRAATPTLGVWMRIIRALIFFHIVCVTWIFFRAENVTQAVGMITTLFSTAGWTDPFVSYAAALLVFFVIPFQLYELWLERKADQLALLNQRVWVQGAMYVYFILMMITFVPGTPQVFIYFQF